MKTFYQLLVNSLIAGVTTNFVWFAVTYWTYLETKSVLATSIVAGMYLATTAISGFWFGSIVDHNKKKTAMLLSSIATLVLFIIGYGLYTITPSSAFTIVASLPLWVLVFILLLGVIAGNIRNIALPTIVTFLVEDDKRDKANGLSGTMMGISFAITAVGSGVVLSKWGMMGILLCAIGFTLISILHLLFIPIPEKKLAATNQDTGENKKGIDILGTLSVIRSIPGLLPLIFFNTFNNLLGGVFMSLMDAYGLTLVSVETWGFLWGFLSLGFIFGGIVISKYGLGKNPLRTLFLANMVMWIISIFFTIQPWIILLSIGMFVWVCLVPFVEAAEQTIIQKVVPHARQGRVFGFSQSVEQAASPLTAFFIGPIAQFIFIPFMQPGGKGAELIGSWYGVGDGRGMALVFSVTGCIGLIVTFFAMRTQAYKMLSEKYLKG